MKPLSKTTLFTGLALTLGMAWPFGAEKQSATCRLPPFATDALAAEAAPGASTATAPASLPRLLDLGAGKCIPCKMMAPILEELKREYAGRMDVEFIDVWQEPGAERKFGVRIIPTQIFYDAAGKELFRHEGFISKKEILAKWKELGVAFPEKTEAR